MSAGPWACLVGEPFIVPWLVHSDGTCRSRTLIYCVVPRSVYSCSEEAHTCLHLLSAGTIPSILRLVTMSLLLAPSLSDIFQFFVLSDDFPTRRQVVAVDRAF